MDPGDTIAFARDIAFLVLVVVTLLAVLIIFLKVSSVLSSAKRTLKEAEDIVTSVSRKVVAPATAGTGVAFGVGKVAAFLFGLSQRRKGKKRSREKRSKGGNDDGE